MHRVPLALLLLCVSATAGIAPETRYALPNGGFEAGASSWTQSGAAFAPASAPARPTHLAAVVAGQARLTQTLPLGGAFDVARRPAQGVPGTKLEAQAWLELDAGHAGDATLELVSRGAGGEIVLARSDTLVNAPRGRWLAVRTRPVAPFDARVLHDSVELELRVVFVGQGTARVDDVRLGHHEREEWELVDQGFEGAGGWTLLGPAARASHAPSYLGSSHLLLSGTGRAAAFQTLEAGASERAPRLGDKPRAGVWVQVDQGALLPGTPDPRVRIDLQVRAVSGATPPLSAPVVARGSLLPVAAQRGRWLWLATDDASAGVFAADHERLVVEVRKQLRGPVRVDHVQLGEFGGVHGMARRHASASYVGRYRSYRWPQAQPVAGDLHARWGTWAWTTPPFCAPTLTTLAHDPDLLRANGRRDAATSTLQGPDWLPLAGAYDSRDADVLRWHVQLLRAAGCDSVLYDFDGHALAAHETSIGREPVNLQTLRALYDACEAGGGDLKIGLMIEPKVHVQGWLPAETTFASRVAGIEDDLVALLAEFAARRATLRRDGAVVVHAFHNAVCAPDGLGCLSGADWDGIVARAEQRSGERVHLVADDVPQDGTRFRATARWSLVTQAILAYRTWSDYAAGNAGSTDAAALAAFVEAIHGASAAWAAQDDGSRSSLGIAWPGFDDSGVAGWSSPNLPGVDGAALCVRVAGPCGGDMFGTTWNGAAAGARDWMLLATFNDWNELTQVEPRWNAAYAQAAAAGLEPAPAARAAALQRIEAWQSKLATWKSLPLDPDAPHRATLDYLRRAALGAATRYD